MRRAARTMAACCCCACYTQRIFLEGSVEVLLGVVDRNHSLTTLGN